MPGRLSPDVLGREFSLGTQTKCPAGEILLGYSHRYCWGVSHRGLLAHGHPLIDPSRNVLVNVSFTKLTPVVTSLGLGILSLDFLLSHASRQAAFELGPS